ncbi:unnamed protein product, partial [Ectocarpus sp. 13 AM-2016]
LRRRRRRRRRRHCRFSVRTDSLLPDATGMPVVVVSILFLVAVTGRSSTTNTNTGGRAACGRTSAIITPACPVHFMSRSLLSASFSVLFHRIVEGLVARRADGHTTATAAAAAFVLC